MLHAGFCKALWDVCVLAMLHKHILVSCSASEHQIFMISTKLHPDKCFNLQKAIQLGTSVALHAVLPHSAAVCSHRATSAPLLTLQKTTAIKFVQ